jgi:rare lipoprotein A
MTCAHKRHPFGAMLRVTAGGKTITCRVTDRGPFTRGRIIDLTPAAARALGLSHLARVVVERI